MKKNARSTATTTTTAAAAAGGGGPSNDANPFLALVNAATSRLEHEKVVSSNVETTPEIAKDSRTSSSALATSHAAAANARMPSRATTNITTTTNTNSHGSTHRADVNESLNDSNHSTSSMVSCHSTSHHGKKRSFAETLMWVLLNDEYSEIVTFLPDDQSFGIVNAKVFVDEVMPKIFGIRTFSSFVRKLNRWGFERIMERKTHDVDVFRHALLRKGDWKRCARIKCVGRAAKNNALPMAVVSAATTRPDQIAMAVDPQPSYQVQQHGLQQPNGAAALAQNFTSFQAITSDVVGAALDTLRRDEHHQLQVLLEQQRQRRQLQQQRRFELERHRQRLEQQQQQEQSEQQHIQTMLAQRQALLQVGNIHGSTTGSSNGFGIAAAKVALALQRRANSVTPRSSTFNMFL